jgi:L-asparagine transporter-like permease
VLETGIIGVAAWIWLLVRLVRRLSAEARRDRTDRGWLLAALAASMVAFGVSMLTYDTFSFVQVMLFFYIFVALASVIAPARQRQTATERPPVRVSLPQAAGALGFALALLALGLVLFVFFQGTSISFLVLVLAILTLGLIGLDRSLDPDWRPRTRY